MSLVSEDLADGRGRAAFGSDRETGEYLRSKAEVDHRRSIPKGSDCETALPNRVLVQAVLSCPVTHCAFRDSGRKTERPRRSQKAGSQRR